MRGPPSVIEREGGQPEHATQQAPSRSRRRVLIVSQPVSLRFLALCGLIVFAVGLWHGRQLAELDGAASIAGEAQSAGTPPAVPANVANPAVYSTAQATAAPSAQPAVITVTIRLLKFNPPQVELKAGDVVEWKNADITPHTATAETKEFDSGSINANASWRYTFARPGTFPYICTFHPEMKGVVVVK